MDQDFQKPFAAPPTIFFVALIVGIGAGLLSPWAMLSWPVQAILGPIVVIAGAYIIRLSMKEIEAAATTYDPFDVSTELVTSGIYQRSRNPGYLGLAIIQLGLAILIDNLWIVATGLVAIAVTTRFVIRLEERKLSDAFGAPYTDYLKQVRRWL